MTMDIQALETPCLLLDMEKTRANILRMQKVCDLHGVALRPHIKTHKMVDVARMQLQAGARGLVCSKASEAEAMLPSGVKEIFIAHSLVDPLKIPRLQRLAESLERLILAVTSVAHAEALHRLLEAGDLSVPVMLALDSGLGREGVRTLEEAREVLARIDASPRMELTGLYTHEGHAYGKAAGDKEAIARDTWKLLTEFRKELNRPLEIWPGCSVTAAILATYEGVDCVRPGAYVFGDHSHACRLKTMAPEQVSLSVVATVIDKNPDGTALIDAGSKVFSGDKTPDRGISGISLDGREIEVARVSEEHGFLAGNGVKTLEIGDKLRLVPAHVCPVMNLADRVLLQGEGMDGESRIIEGRGCSQ